MARAGISRPRDLARRLQLSPALRQALVVTLVMRLAWSLVAAVAQPSSVGRGGWVDFGGVPRPTGAMGRYLLEPWLRDDAIWYQRIARTGYHSDGSGAFFPLYPALTHGAGVVLGGAYLLAGLLVSALAMVAALALLFELVRRDFDAASARRTTWLLVLWPFAFFLLAPFSEGTFLLLSAATLLAARRRRHDVAAVCAGLAVLCRVQGLLLFIPVAVEAWGDPALAASLRARCLRLARSAVPAALAVGFLLLLSQQMLGSPLAMLRAQTYWGSHVALPPVVFADSIRAIAGGQHPEEFWNLLAATGAIALLPLMIRRLPAAYWAYGCALLAAIWFHEERYSPLMSAGRFLAVDIPLFVAVALELPRWPRLVRRLLVLSPVLGAVFVANMVDFHFVG